MALPTSAMFFWVGCDSETENGSMPVAVLRIRALASAAHALPPSGGEDRVAAALAQLQKKLSSRATLVLNFVGAELAHVNTPMFERIFDTIAARGAELWAKVVAVQLPWELVAVHAMARHRLMRRGVSAATFYRVGADRIAEHIPAAWAEKVLATPSALQHPGADGDAPGKPAGEAKAAVSILRRKEAPPVASDKRVTFSRTSPGPGERPAPAAKIVLTPSKELVFHEQDESTPVSTQINVRNVSRQPIMFKLKTTSPDNYRVRPNTGVVDPGADVNVSIKRRTASRLPFRDRFLVMTCNASEYVKLNGAAEPTQKTITAFMSTVPRSRIAEFRLHSTSRLKSAVEEVEPKEIAGPAQPDDAKPATIVAPQPQPQPQQGHAAREHFNDPARAFVGVKTQPPHRAGSNAALVVALLVGILLGMVLEELASIGLVGMALRARDEL